MKFDPGEERFVSVRTIRVRNIIIELGLVAQIVHIAEEIEEYVSITRQTLTISDTYIFFKLEYSDGQYWLKRES